MGLQDDELFLAGRWKTDIADFSKGIDMIVTKYGELMKVSRETKLSFGAEGAANVKQQLEQSRLATAQYKEEVARLNAVITQKNKAEQEAAKTSALQAKSLAAQTRAEIILAKEIERKNKLIEKETANITKQKGAYAQLSAEYNKVAKEAQDYAAEISILNRTPLAPGQRERLNELQAGYATASKKAMGLQTELLKIDQSVGHSQRNVGNYNESVRQLGYILQELPNAGISFRTFLQSISNNLADFFRSITAAVAGGKTWKQALGDLGKSLFSIQTLIVLGVTALTYYASTLTKANSSTSLAEAANKKYADSLKTIEENARASAFEEIAHMKALTSVAADLNATTKNRERAVTDLQKTYPDYFGNLSKEEILQGNVAAAIEAGTKALLARASAQAAEKKIAAAGEKRYDLILAERKANEELAKSVAVLAKADKLSGRNSDERENRGLSQFNAIQAGTAAKNSLGVIKKGIADADKELEQYGKDLTEFASKAGEAFFDKDPKAKKTRTPKSQDLTNETIASEKFLTETLADIQKARFEIEAQGMEDIFNNEKEELQKRLDAYEKYESDKLSILHIDQQKEVDVIQNSLDTIADIEKISVSKRTNEQKKLLLQKEGFEAKKKEIGERYQYLEQKIITDGNEKIRNIQEQGIKEQLRVIMQGAQDIENQVRESENRKIILLNTALKNNLITYEQYTKDYKRISDEANADILKGQMTYFDNYLDELKRNGVISGEIVQKIKDALAKELKKEAKGDKKSSITEDLLKSIFPEMTDAQREGIIKAYAGAISSIYSSLQTIAANKFAAEIDRLEEEKAAIKDRYEYERDQIQYTYKTQEERAAALSDLQARTQLQEADAQRRINDRKRKQAQAEKQAAAFEATARGAVAIITAFRDLGPIAGAIAAVAVGAAVAAQLAAINSAPLPEYYKGTDSAKAGLAHVGERGAELMVGKNGIELIPDHQIRKLEGGEKIFTADETNQILKSGALGGSVRRSNGHNEWVYYNALLTNNDKNSRRIERAIRETKPNIKVIQRDSSYISRIIRN